MGLWGRFGVLVARFLSFSTLSPFDGADQPQTPLGLVVPAEYIQAESVVVPPPLGPNVADNPLVFRPPGHRQGNGDGFEFQCNYTAMGDKWAKCSKPDRTCWLQNKETLERYDIYTDYENKYPNGTIREYWLDVTKSNITADGYTFFGATVFNNSYPGPWIQACWGDTVRIHVRNLDPDRGTSVHWHGIRQLNSMHMDGVNGVTQCPIAPGSSFTYEWKVMQYGSSWYHSHYSEQYADGAVGPITLHGPSSDEFDEAADIPTLMTDWRHGSVFGASDNGQQVVSILLNGSGDVTQFGPNKTERWTNTSAIPTPYTLTFNDTLAPGGRPGRYLLRLINTSIGSTFIFSIDNHLLTVVSADFVPIYPYMTTSVLIGIGQRYNVIVEADPTARGLAEKLKGEQNYWIRTWVVDNCGPGIGPKSRQNLTRYPYMQTGIVRYDNTSTAKPISKEWNDVPKTCSDETYTNLRPVLPWVVGNPINTISTGIHGIQHVSIVGGDPPPGFPKASIAFHNDTQNNDTDASHDLDFTPLQIDFSRPILLELNNTKEPWNSMWQVYPEGRDGQENDWVWLAITVGTKGKKDTQAHPLHLHGHDFAILQQIEDAEYNATNIRINRINPPRRNVVLMPNKGFVIIAFKADNPGSWLMHCHIAGHASGGLALQILERQANALEMWPPGSEVFNKTEDLCRSWNAWVEGPPAQPTPLPDDSGI